MLLVEDQVENNYLKKDTIKEFISVQPIIKKDRIRVKKKPMICMHLDIQTNQLENRQSKFRRLFHQTPLLNFKSKMKIRKKK